MHAFSTKFSSLKYRDMSLPYLSVGESSYFLWYHTDKVLYHLNPTFILTSSQKGLIIENLRFFKNKNLCCNLTKFCRARMFSLLSSLQTSSCTGVSRRPSGQAILHVPWKMPCAFLPPALIHAGCCHLKSLPNISPLRNWIHPSESDMTVPGNFIFP